MVVEVYFDDESQELKGLPLTLQELRSVLVELFGESLPARWVIQYIEKGAQFRKITTNNEYETFCETRDIKSKKITLYIVEEKDDGKSPGNKKKETSKENLLNISDQFGFNE